MTVARTSNPMLNRSDMSGHSHVFPGFARKTFSFSLLRMMLALGLLQVAFIMLKNVPSMPTVMRVFSCRILSNAFFFYIYWDNFVILILLFLMYSITVIYLWVLLKIFIYLWLCWVFLTVHGLSLVAESMSYSLVVVGRLLIEVTSLVASLGSMTNWLQLLWHVCSVFVVRRL